MSLSKTYRGRLWSHLDVDVCTVPHEQLEAEGAVARGGGEVKRGEALLVDLVDVGARLDELVHHHVLAVVAGHVQRRVPVRVRLVYLERRCVCVRERGRETRKAEKKDERREGER